MKSIRQAAKYLQKDYKKKQR